MIRFAHLHRTMAQVAETERLRNLLCTPGRTFSRTEMLQLEILTELERANNPPAVWSIEPENAA